MSDNTEPTSKFFHSQGLKLHYLDWGNTLAPTLILVHGMHDHARSWDWVARDLSQNWHVIAVDLRGHGDSGWSPDRAYHNPYLLHDLVDLVDSLDAETVTIVAHSLGGNPATRFAALYPKRVDKLVLVDAMGPYPSVVEAWNKHGVVNRSRYWLEKSQKTANKVPRGFATLDEAIARMAKVNKHLSAEQVSHLATHGVCQYDDGYGWKYDPATGNFLPEDFAISLEAYWREITSPTLICWGSDSWTSSPAIDGSAAHFCNHQSVEFENAGHWIHHDQFDEFMKALNTFFNDQ
ncbi:alpha/beta fold hydrolase [Pseudomaricurvus sp.]|uniref:alpha/beta fold hydrolase n=1 Tax=Pseudomaricurvus sp. TaxID=2004510 RepID=UPI003F6B28AB